MISPRFNFHYSESEKIKPIFVILKIYRRERICVKVIKVIILRNGYLFNKIYCIMHSIKNFFFSYILTIPVKLISRQVHSWYLMPTFLDVKIALQSKVYLIIIDLPIMTDFHPH